MGKINHLEYLLLLARLTLSAVFLFAALPKIQDPVAFAASIEAYHVISAQSVMWVAIVLPWLELFIGIGILMPQLRRASGLLIVALLIVFIGLHASAWVRGLDISCGCFGQSETEASPNYLWLIFRNLALMIAATGVTCRDFTQLKASSKCLNIIEKREVQ